MYVCMYVCVCVLKIFKHQVIIQASFVKDDVALLFLILFFQDSLLFF